MLRERQLGILTQRKGLLERAASYLRVVTSGVTEAHLGLPTPCDDWDLRALICHLNESLAALYQAIGSRYLSPVPTPSSMMPDDLLATSRYRVSQLLHAWVARGEDGDRGTVAVGGHPLASTVIANTGAVEIAVHGWDIARTCHLPADIPATLALDLTEIARLAVPAARHPEFGPAVTLDGPASAGDRLVAWLGRDPTR